MVELLLVDNVDEARLESAALFDDERRSCLDFSDGGLLEPFESDRLELVVDITSSVHQLKFRVNYSGESHVAEAVSAEAHGLGRRLVRATSTLSLTLEIAVAHHGMALDP